MGVQQTIEHPISWPEVGQYPKNPLAFANALLAAGAAANVATSRSLQATTLGDGLVLEGEHPDRAAYVAALKRHDWQYRWSDSGRTYNAGREERKALEVTRAAIDPHYALWNQHCHPECVNGGGAL